MRRGGLTLDASLVIGGSCSAGGIPSCSMFESYDAGAESKTAMYGNSWRAQTFTPAVAHTIYFVMLKLERNANPGDITVSIRATAGGLPTGGDLAVGTRVTGDITAGPPEWYKIEFATPLALNNGTEYAIVARCLAGDASNSLDWVYHDVVASYAGGQRAYSFNAGVDWTAGAGDDHRFEEWGV